MNAPQKSVLSLKREPRIDTDAPALEERLKLIARQDSVDLQRLRRQVAFDRSQDFRFIVDSK